MDDSDEEQKRKRLKVDKKAGPSVGPRTSRRSSSTHDKAIFTPDCIFCNKVGRKKVKVKGTWTSEGTTGFEFGKWKNVFTSAEKKQDETLLTRIRGYDLFACEAKYHRNCHNKYLVNPELWRSTNVEDVKAQTELEKAHQVAFDSVAQYVDSEIICGKKLIQLSVLRDLYVTALQNTEFSNPDYRSENLKAKLEKNEKYSHELAFCKLDKTGKYQSYIVYSSKTDIESAVKCAYVLGSKNVLEEVASYLRSVILEAYTNADDLRWPPVVQELGAMTTNVIPPALERFLNYVLSGKLCVQSTKVSRLVCSIGQDICRAVTNGQWKMPKHIMVCMTLRHMFRSAELTTLFNRLGHSESYSFSLELETAIAEALQHTSTLLTTRIVRNPNVPSIFHSEFDNFDQLINDLTGKGSIHTAHGIMMQDIDCENDHGGIVPEIPTVSKTKTRSLKLESAETLPECFITLRRSPGYDVIQWTHPESGEINNEIATRNLLWILIRFHKSKTDQEVPAWTGFVSLTGETPTKLTTIDYYPVINKPITDYKTVQECLRYAENATKEVGQDYTITTFDLGVCMKAYPIIWNWPERYNSHIAMIGTFHMACAYMKMLGKKMNGSGLSDVFLEADLIGAGSLQGVMSGKHYERAMYCHKNVLEGMERLLLNQFLSSRNEENVFESVCESSRKKIDDLVHFPSEDNMKSVLSDDEVANYIRQLVEYRENVRHGVLGKTAQLWMCYMDHVWLVLQLIQAVKTNNFPQYAQCLHLMPDIFFSFGGQNYARYLTFYSVFIANIETSHPGATELLKRGAISVARSFIPGNRCAVDKTMEETFMKHAKSHGGAGGSGAGLSGLLTNYDVYQRWVRTTQERSKYVEATLSMADMLTESQAGSRHSDLRLSEILKSEKSDRCSEQFHKPIPGHGQGHTILHFIRCQCSRSH